jgi:hypothetical protein
MFNKLKFNVCVDYVRSNCEKVGEEGKKDFDYLSDHITNLKKASDPPMINDDVLPSEDDNIWGVFDDDFNDK